MKVSTFAPTDAVFEKSPDQDDEVYSANLVDERDDSPVTIGYGRYGPNSELTETMLVDDIMVVIEGRLEIVSDGKTAMVGVGGIVQMPKGRTVTIRATGEGATTAYVTYPHWREAR